MPSAILYPETTLPPLGRGVPPGPMVFIPTPPVVGRVPESESSKERDGDRLEHPDSRAGEVVRQKDGCPAEPRKSEEHVGQLSDSPMAEDTRRG